MSSLREIKTRIGSVKSTLKITSAMKLVASSKLRKAQNAIEAMRPYEQALAEALKVSAAANGGRGLELDKDLESGNGNKAQKTAVVAVSSNTSLCGGFNANVIKKTLSAVSALGKDNADIYTLGRKMADAVKRAGYAPIIRELENSPSYSSAASLSEELVEKYQSGEYSGVVLIYSHFVSMSHQEVVEEKYLPFTEVRSNETEQENLKIGGALIDDYIIEPSPKEIVETLTPRVLSLKLYAMLLDSAAAEHSARMIAMQAATDNGNELLAELSLVYNKERQQKITSEILDLVGGKTE